MKPKRKYYKENSDAELLKCEIKYKCPNTGEEIVIEPSEWSWSGYEDRMGTYVNIWFQCNSCLKHHTVYLRNG